MKSHYIKKTAVVLCTIIFLYWFFYDTTYDEKLEIIISPCNEECDDFDCIWLVDSVNNDSFSFLKGELIYLEKSAKMYTDSTQFSYKVSGYLYKNKHSAEFLECGSPWSFIEDSTIIIIKELPQLN